MSDKVNGHGVPEKDLILTVYEGHISALPLIRWIRDLKRRLWLLKMGIEDPTPADYFCAQMVRDNFHSCLAPGGTHTLLPEDVSEFIGYLRNAATKNESTQTVV
jgi:hypothetical protein